MKLTVQVVLHADDDTETVVREVFTVQREQPLAPDTLGLGLGEAKDLLAAVQHTLVENQVAAALSTQVGCPECGLPRRHKDSRPIVMRTLFGRLRLDSPRWWHCGCSPQAALTFSPLASMLPERTTPELSYLQARFAGLVSYGLSTDLLGELLPLGRALHANTVRRQVQATAQRLEDELGEERWSFIDSCQRDREELPRPELPLVVGLDGGYVHSSAQASRRDGWFEVIAGKAMPSEGRASCFGYVQTYDTKPKRRLFEVLKAQGMQENQQVTFLTDGGEDIRDLPCYLNPQAEHLLDWFHITMRITVMTNMAKSLQPPPPDPDLGLSAETATKLIARIGPDLQRLKWFLWHGNVFRALQTVEDLTADLETLHPEEEPTKLGKAVREFDSYLRANAERIPNYGERQRAGEAISTAFVESTVNQVISKRMVKKQQMRWSPRGAHLLLQVRTRVLNNTLTKDYRRWYPGFTHTPEADTLNDQLVAA
ncbi:MAG: ISKra4 family transposase [Pseudonocardiaceae bacterium]